jgi:hypothetical protein
VKNRRVKTRITNKLKEPYDPNFAADYDVILRRLAIAFA